MPNLKDLNRILGIKPPERRSLTIQESLPALPDKRILILGSRMVGSNEVASALSDYLKTHGITGASVETLRDVAFIKRAILGQKPGQRGIKPAIGVVLLPEMRQYTPIGDMTIDTYTSGVSTHVEALCQQLGIPLIEITRYEDIQRIMKTNLRLSGV